MKKFIFAIGIMCYTLSTNAQNHLLKLLTQTPLNGLNVLTKQTAEQHSSTKV